MQAASTASSRVLDDLRGDERGHRIEAQHLDGAEALGAAPF